MQYSSKTLTLAFGAAALSLVASTASADTVKLSYSGVEYNPFVREKIDVNPKEGTNFETMNVGGFKMNTSNAVGSSAQELGKSILAWCVEVTQDLSENATYTIATTAQKWTDSLTRLFDKHFDDVRDSITSAAMQLAIWEIVGGDATLSLKNGNFQAKPATTGVLWWEKPLQNSVDAINKAQSWLDGLYQGDVEHKYEIVHLTSGKSQDLVTVNRISVSEVPLPGAALMFLSALGVGGLARRKRAANDDEALAA